MCAEASTILRAVAADFSFNVGIWRSLRKTVFGTHQGASTIMRKAFNWKRSRILHYRFESDEYVRRNLYCHQKQNLLGI
jgi:hypothetical protein